MEAFLEPSKKEGSAESNTSRPTRPSAFEENRRSDDADRSSEDGPFLVAGDVNAQLHHPRDEQERDLADRLAAAWSRRGVALCPGCGLATLPKELQGTILDS